MSSVHLEVERSIKRRKPGRFIFPADLTGLEAGRLLKWRWAG
ncbi:hypothetical protein [Pedobacter rhizosphaerae]|nr:hypothetical protein [Pedobacter rhizosphaerae]